MSAALDSFDFVSVIHWNSAFYGTMAAASSATEAVQKKATEIALPLRLWRVAWKLRDLVEMLEHPDKIKPTPKAERVDIHTVLEQFDVMFAAVDDLYLRCKRAGRTNNTLTAAQLNSIVRNNDTIRDFAERVKLTIDPQTDEIFRRARESRQAYGTVPMSNIF